MDGWLEVLQPLEVNIHTASLITEGLRCWNLCSMAAANILDADIRKCERLHVKFPNLAETTRFNEALRACRKRQAEREEDNAAATNAALAQIFQAARTLSAPNGLGSSMSPRSSGLFSPPARQKRHESSASPQRSRPTRSSAPLGSHIAQYNIIGRPPAVASPYQHHFTPQAFPNSSEPVMTPALPADDTAAHPCHELSRHQSLPYEADLGHLGELSTERQTREVHGDSQPTQEMAADRLGRWGGRGHERF